MLGRAFISPGTEACTFESEEGLLLERTREANGRLDPGWLTQSEIWAIPQARSQIMTRARSHFGANAKM